jgi:ketosteroid isomerase-like protein
MDESLALALVRAFVAKINAHQVDGLYALMTDDHRYVDAFGAVAQGRAVMRHAWSRYFTQVPDYSITCDQVLSGGDTIAIFGKAGGTDNQAGQLDPTHRWEVPAVWKVVVRGTRVAAWHVYMDTHPLRHIMAQVVRQAVESEATGAGVNLAHTEVV